MLGQVARIPQQRVSPAHCKICGVNKHHHLSAVGHIFIPGDVIEVDALPWELRLGDIVKGVDSHTIVVQIYRRP